MPDLSEFHFLRPLWLLALLPALVLLVGLWRQRLRQSGWLQTIDSHLLPHLLIGEQRVQARWPLLALGLAWLLGALALAGPTWQQKPVPVFQQQDALVVALDLSVSMYASDNGTSRLVQARHKLQDLTRLRREGLLGLLVYAGDAHPVVPLSDDTATFTSLSASLDPALMPSQGSHVEAAVERALQMFDDAGLQQGRLLLITDGIASDAIPTVRQQLAKSDIEVSILGLGKRSGSPIPLPDGGLLKDRNGGIVMAKLNQVELQNLANSLGGRYAQVQIGDQDLEYLISTNQALGDSQELERHFDEWEEMGPYLVLVLLPLALLGFRRGWLVGIALCITPLYPLPSQALEWDDWWQTRDQQAVKALEQGDAATAAELFKDPLWQATANYQQGQYEAALEGFSQDPSAKGHYNRGNALAKLGRLEEALDAYQRALESDSELADAKANHDLVQQLLEQMQQQQNQPGQDGQSNSGEGSQSQQGDGSDTQPADGSQSQQADGSQSQPADGSQSQQADGSQSQQADGSQSQPADGSQSQQADGSQPQPADGSQSQQADGSQPQPADGSQSEPTDGSESQQASANNDDSDEAFGPRGSDDVGEAQSLADPSEQDPNSTETPSAASAAEAQSAAQDKEPTASDSELQQKHEEGNQIAAADSQLSPGASTEALHQQSEQQTEQQRAMEQWMRRVPDDPGGLLRRKFLYQYQRQQQQQQRRPQSESERW